MTREDFLGIWGTLANRKSLFAAIWLFVCVVVLGSSYGIVGAQTVRNDDIDSVIYETPFYDIVPLGSCGAAAEASGVTLEGKDNIQKAFNYFIGKGLTPAQSAGIVGNLRQESGVNPKSHQNGGGKGRGIAQWEIGDRWDKLVAWANGKGLDPWEIGTQLEYLWKEMPGQYPYTHLGELQAILPAATAKTSSLEAVKMSQDVVTATKAFEYTYERAGTPVMENRITYAKEVLDAFGGLVPSNVSATGACGGTGISIDGYSFPVAPQTRRSYSTLPCPTTNPNAQTLDYTDKFGKTTHLTTCHHDATPAYDLMYSGVAGKPVYAITKGRIIKVDRSYVMDSSKAGKACGAIQYQSTNGTDNTYYWYGHILPGTNVVAGREFDAGDQLGIVATNDYGPKCWGGGPHLHIDRGCISPDGKPQQGGTDNCRDPQFLQDLEKIWENLPEG
jgi:hypothetical protein